jgi:iron complex transport system substrate-binding protein
VRVVSLTCSNTEIVCALGMGRALVGVDDHSDFPVDVVARLPRVGPDLTIDLDAVSSLRPDLVLASLTVPGHERVVAGVERSGMRWIAPEPERLDDVYRDVAQIAELLGVPERGERLVAELREGLEGERVDVAEQDRPSVLVEWWPKPVIAPGRRSWVTDLIALAGGRNPLDRDCRSSPLTDDEVVAMAPDAVVVCWCGVPFHRYRPDVVTRRAAWQGLPALRNGQVHLIPEAYLGRPGPRLLDGFRALRDVIRDIPARDGGSDGR